MEILTEQEKQKLILEKWSISDKVDDAVDEIFSTVTKTRSYSDIQKLDKDVYMYINNVSMKIFDMNFQLWYYIYSCHNREVCDFIYHNAENMNAYIEKENKLVITLYDVLGKYVTEYNTKNIVHEVEHMLQIHYGMKHNPNYIKLMDKAYDFASDVKYNMENHNNEEILIANLIYYSNSHEQDAFINEYYNEIKFNFGKYLIKQTETDQIFYNFQYYVDRFFKEIDTNIDLQKALSEYKQFGYNQNNFSIMIKKQLHRFEKKMNNVRKHFKQLSMMEKKERFFWAGI